MADCYEMVESTDPKKPGWNVRSPDGHIIWGDPMPEEAARDYLEVLNSFRLDKALPKEN